MVYWLIRRYTLPTIERVSANYNLTWGKLRQEYGGWTWHAIADELLATTVSNAALPPIDVLADELATAFPRCLKRAISVHGATGAAGAASKVGRVAVVTGSRGPLVEAWLQHFHVRDCVELIVGAESYERTKPTQMHIRQRWGCGQPSDISCLRIVRRRGSRRGSRFACLPDWRNVAARDAGTHSRSVC